MVDLFMGSGSPRRRAPNNDNTPSDLGEQVYRPPHYEFNQWHEDQIFVSVDTAFGIASGGVIPNVNDLVINFDNNRKIEKRVVFVNPTTWKSTLELVEYPQAGSDVSIGIPVGVGNLSSVAILYFNPNDPKMGVEVDYRLPIMSVYGSTLSYVRLFLGSDVGPNGRVISINYDNLGNVVNDRINVERVDIYDDTTKRYIIRPGSIDMSVAEDTLVTMCLYNDINVMVSYQTLVVKYNGLVSNLANRTLYVNRVYLETPYMNPADSSEILIPKNLLVNSFVPRVFKEYNTGSREELIFGTSDISLFGWGDHVNGVVGDNFPLILNYILKPHERSEEVSQFTGSHIVENYKVRIIDSDVAVDVKLFVLPTYDLGSHAYVLKFYLYSGMRNIAKEVTDKVVIQGFVGTKYAAKQKIDFSLDLTDIEGMPDMIFANTIELMLMDEPMATSTMYRLWYYRDTSRWYGEHLRAQILNHFGTRTLNITNQITQKDEWLERMFYQACPLYDASVVNEAPAPKFVDVTIGSVTRTVDIDTYWNGETSWDEDQSVSVGDNVILRWYSHNDSGERLELAITNMPLEVI